MLRRVVQNISELPNAAAAGVVLIDAQRQSIKRHQKNDLSRKDIVVIDNLPAHKAPGVRDTIEARGATLRYLPQYPPDLNPIEMPFSKLNASLRKARVPRPAE